MRATFLAATMAALLPAVTQAQTVPPAGDDPHAQHGTGQHQHMPEAPRSSPTIPSPTVPPEDQHHAAGHEGHHGSTAAAHPAGHGAGHAMAGALGPYPMTRDASGTAWQPDSLPMEAIHGRLGGWSTMLHGFATLIHDDQGGPRGDKKTFVASMLMGMAQRPVGTGTLTLRAMGSLDPLMGKDGYPLLLATGETADGETELVDRQHPHDLFMELAAIYSRPLGGKLSGFAYFGLPGEPALGPATYMHRFSGMANPEAPIGHHWLDSTHVTFGVATLGLVHGRFKLEGSLFTGREPDENRYDIERPRFDSWSFRGTWNPSANLSMQVSHGRLKSPEKLHAEENVRRTTASITHNVAIGGGARGNWQTSFAWGRNDPDEGATTDAFLLDSAVSIGRNTLLGRLENVDKDELFANDEASPLHEGVFNVTKLSIGGFHTIPVGKLALDVGGLVSRYDLPAAIRPVYGADPTSFMLFTRIKIVG
jgi:hypothetical protein